ncbi:MAG: aromatic ring-hydroxylating dioxygenase subunit alpha [Proteobacteria bacterium]|nr:aromatic ring-hydroxylating dioxygenase subunit alpha [Pseudomonadota bacterium]
MDAHARSTSHPPRFREAKNLRQRCRAAGMDPDYWYPAVLEKDMKRGQVREIVFQGRSIAVFRGEDGEPRAVDNRCAHRQLKLSSGSVEGCQLVCPYHGWAYDGSGQLVRVDHELYGRKQPRLRIPAFPVQVRYGLVWVFPGDPERAAERALPEIPELEGPDRWACVPIHFEWQAHHSMVIDNVSDFSHAHLHRKYRPFTDAVLTRCEAKDDRVYVAYDTHVGGGRISQHFVDRKQVDTSQIELCYEYPYQWSDTDGQIKHWLFVRPVDERTTAAFFLFYFKSFKVPGSRVRIPRSLMTPLLHVANRLMVKPLLGQDGFALEAEQEGYEACWDAPNLELNPAVRAFQTLTVRKWEEHLERAEASAQREGA